MLRIAFSTLAARKSGMIGAFAAVGLAVILVVSCGILLQSSLRAPIAVDRLHNASVVVEAATTVNGAQGQGNVNSVAVSDKSRVRASVASRLRGIAGVKSVIADRSVYAAAVDRHGRLIKGENGALSVGHGWESAQLTPYVLTSGHAPTHRSEIVVDEWVASRGAVHVGQRLRILTAAGAETFTIAGIADHTRAQPLPEQAAVFFRSDVAARLAGGGDRVDLLGILTRRGADTGRIADAVRKQLHGT